MFNMISPVLHEEINLINILIISKEAKWANSLAFILRETGMSCKQSNNGHAGCKVARRENPDIIFLDMSIPDMSGLEALEWLKVNLPYTSVIIVSENDNTLDAVKAMKLGASDFVIKPIKNEDLVPLVERSIDGRKSSYGAKRFHKKDLEQITFLGNSATTTNFRDCIRRVAISNVNIIFLYGETGTGKNIIARELYLSGHRKEKPYFEISCGTIPSNLLEAEIFGAKSNELQRAAPNKIGLLETAEGGTLFIDEIEKMPLNVQSKLFKYFETSKFQPVGSTTELYSNVRVILASNNDLEGLVKKETFRKDLYFQLKIMPLQIPSLRDRGDDVIILADYIAEKLARETATEKIFFSSTVLKIFQNYNWPGNVRELKNIIENLSVLYPGQTINLEHLPAALRDINLDENLTYKEKLMKIERNLIKEALFDCHGKKGVAAEKLGISRYAMKRKMLKLGIK